MQVKTAENFGKIFKVKPKTTFPIDRAGVSELARKVEKWLRTRSGGYEKIFTSALGG